jgi:hypothetical protein
MRRLTTSLRPKAEDLGQPTQIGSEDPDTDELVGSIESPNLTEELS